MVEFTRLNELLTRKIIIAEGNKSKRSSKFSFRGHIGLENANWEIAKVSEGGR